MARKNRNARKREIVPIEELVAPTPEQMAKGNIKAGFVVHVDSWTTTKAHRVYSVIDDWFDQGWPGFEEPARAAINWCHARWEARGVIGKQCANYSPVRGGSGNAGRDSEIRDELDTMKALFPIKHWDVYENCVRWGQPAGRAGSDFANNNPQAIASARAIVGMIANMIAHRIGL